MGNHDNPESIAGRQFTRLLRKVVQRFLLRKEPVVVVRHDLESIKQQKRIPKLSPFDTGSELDLKTNLEIPLRRSSISFSNALNSSVTPDLSLEEMTSPAHYVEMSAGHDSGIERHTWRNLSS